MSSAKLLSRPALVSPTVLIVSVLLGITPVFPSEAASILLFIGLFTIRWTHVRAHWVFLVFIAQYGLIQIGWNMYHSPPFDRVALNEAYTLIIIGAPLLLCAILFADGHRRVFMTGLQVGLWGSIIVLFMDHIGLDGEISCRASGGTFNPLLPAFSLAIFMPVLLTDWSSLTQKQKFFRLLLVGWIVAAVIAFTGGRASFFTSVAFSMCTMCYVTYRDRHAWNAIVLALSMILAGIMLSFVSIQTGCSLSYRFLNSMNAVKFLSDNFGNLASILRQPTEQILESGMPASEGYRLIAWNAAFTAIQEEPLVGYGRAFERQAIGLYSDLDIVHTHNQFLSWLIWGGPIALMSGILLGLSSLLSVRKWMFIPVATILIAGAILMTDTLLMWQQVLHSLIPILTVSYVLYVWEVQDKE